MIGRVLLAALLAGIAAGLVMAVIQHVRLTPLILEAETYEAAGGHSHDTGAAAGATEEHQHGEGWMPADGWQRTLSTTVTAMMTGAAFALVLAGISLLTNLKITRQNGFVWGLAGFLAVTLAPAAGLPPELPGMQAADLASRQIWWVGTILATGLGIYLLATRKEVAAQVVAVLIIATPHLVGAPVPVGHDSPVPAHLAASFAANAIAAGAVMWALIGIFLGFAIPRFANELHDT